MRQSDLGSVGVFVGRSRLLGADGEEFARTAEEAGYGALWVADVDERLAVLRTALAATRRLPVGSAVLSIWLASAERVAERFSGLRRRFADRVIAGLGVSHAPLVERSGLAYREPYATLSGYLDELASAGHPMRSTVIGANGPKMLALAARHTAGAVPYLITPEQTARAREQLGSAALLCPVQKVVLGTDIGAARALARSEIAIYLGLPNYVRGLLRMGFGEDDLSGGGSDRLVDALVACGDEEVVRRRVDEQLACGADHVAVHALCAEGLPTDAVRSLAPALVRS